MTADMKTWWLSFVDAELPPGEQFLGVCIVEAETDLDAVRTTHSLGINPGGEVIAVQIAPTDPSAMNRLLGKDKAARLSAQVNKPKPPYPWCLHPDKCIARGRCTRNPNCGD